MKTFTITNKTAERDHNGRPTGRTSYSVTGSNGATYEAYAPHGGLPWEVATLAKRADGGRAWRWAKDVTKGVASLIVAHIESSILPSVQPVNVETFTETNAMVCFRACAAAVAITMGENLKRTGAHFMTANQAFNASGFAPDLQDVFTSGYLIGAPKRVFVTHDCKVTTEQCPHVACVVGVGLIA